MEGQKSIYKTELTNLNSKLTETEKKVEKLTLLNNNQGHQISKSVNDAEMLQSRISELNELNTQKEGKLNELNSKILSLNKENEVFKNEMGQEIQNLKEKIKNKEENCKSKLIKMKISINNLELEDQLQIIQVEIKEQKEKMEEKEKLITELISNKQNKNTTINQLNKDIEILNNELESLKIAHENLKNQSATEKASLQKIHKDEILILKSEASKLENNNEVGLQLNYDF